MSRFFFFGGRGRTILSAYNTPLRLAHSRFGSRCPFCVPLPPPRPFGTAPSPLPLRSSLRGASLPRLPSSPPPSPVLSSAPPTPLGRGSWATPLAPCRPPACAPLSGRPWAPPLPFSRLLALPGCCFRLFCWAVACRPLRSASLAPKSSARRGGPVVCDPPSTRVRWASPIRALRASLALVPEANRRS